MDTKLTAVGGSRGSPDPQVDSAGPALRRVWRGIRTRLLGGLVFVLPILITLWVIYWLYSTLDQLVIDPLARLVLWNVRWGQPGAELPFWFEVYAAPVIGFFLALTLLYCLGFFVNSRVRRAVDWVLLRVPLVSVIYKGVGKVFEALEKQPGQQRPQRVVLVEFPHPGMKVPAFVTATCRDIETQRVILCVYVPTTPVPTSGYFLLVPEEEVTELNWTSEEALQAIISAGFTAPPEVHYFKTRTAGAKNLGAGAVSSEAPPDAQIAPLPLSGAEKTR
jgi:uncharacterized membrane protein